MKKHKAKPTKNSPEYAQFMVLDKVDGDLWVVRVYLRGQQEPVVL